MRILDRETEKESGEAFSLLGSIRDTRECCGPQQMKRERGREGSKERVRRCQALHRQTRAHPFTLPLLSVGQFGDHKRQHRATLTSRSSQQTFCFFLAYLVHASRFLRVHAAARGGAEGLRQRTEAGGVHLTGALFRDAVAAAGTGRAAHQSGAFLHRLRRCCSASGQVGRPSIHDIVAVGNTVVPRLLSSLPFPLVQSWVVHEAATERLRLRTGHRTGHEQPGLERVEVGDEDVGGRTDLLGVAVVEAAGGEAVGEGATADEAATTRHDGGRGGLGGGLVLCGEAATPRERCEALHHHVGVLCFSLSALGKREFQKGIEESGKTVHSRDGHKLCDLWFSDV